jgi:hypothetical protein
VSTYRVQYSDEARDALAGMTRARRVSYDHEIARIAARPHRHGKAVGGTRDRREAVVAGTVTVYWVSGSVLTVSVVRIVHTD